jgi:hypothetical protein
VSELYIANVTADTDPHVMRLLLHKRGYSVSVVEGAGVTVRHFAEDEDAFLARLERDLAPFAHPIIDDHGPAGR